MATVNINIEVLNSKPPISDESNTKKTEGQQLNQFQLSVLPLFSVDLEGIEPSSNSLFWDTLRFLFVNVKMISQNTLIKMF